MARDGYRIFDSDTHVGAVAVRDADPIGHLVGADHVAPAHLGGLEAQGARYEVDCPS